MQSKTDLTTVLKVRESYSKPVVRTVDAGHGARRMCALSSRERREARASGRAEVCDFDCEEEHGASCVGHTDCL